MASAKYDLVVVGSGPGGYVAAIRASQLGLKTAIVEEKHLGGICLNWGCIPTKALLRCSEIHHLLHHLDDFGFSAKDIRFDIQKIVARSRAVADQLSKGVTYLMKKNKVDVIEGRGRLAGKGRLTIEKAKKKIGEVEAKHIILGTGARAKTLPGLQPDGERIWTYMEAMVPKTFPKSLLIIGSGAIGIEFAEFLSKSRGRGHGRGNSRSHPPGGGRGNLRSRTQGLRKTGHPNPYPGGRRKPESDEDRGHGADQSGRQGRIG